MLFFLNVGFLFSGAKVQAELKGTEPKVLALFFVWVVGVRVGVGIVPGDLRKRAPPTKGI